jgi:DNA oxidative demethylase
VTEPPDGLRFTPDLLARDEEDALVTRLDGMAFDPIEIRGQVARRTALHFGVGYDYDSRQPRETAPIPDWPEPLRGRAARWTGMEPERLVEALVQRYPPGAAIGWHRDAPAFGEVVGVSLLAACRLRFRPAAGGGRATFQMELPRGSGYLLAGAARWRFQHAIPPVSELRYSVTFRTLRDAAGTA